MQIGTKNIWFKPETESQKEKITNGFKELYQHECIINCTKEDLSTLFLQQLELIIKFAESKKIKSQKNQKVTQEMLMEQIKENYGKIFNQKI